MKILCYGDSNTFGMDARGPLSSRFDETVRWCDRLAAATGWEILNRGKNGRCIPGSTMEFEEAQYIFSCQSNLDAALIMLGTNDVLLHSRTAEDVAGRMDILLTYLRKDYPTLPLVLIAPPPLNIPEKELCAQISLLPGFYQFLAEQHNCYFLDAFSWAPSLSYDGIHLSAEGHSSFARKLAAALTTIL